MANVLPLHKRVDVVRHLVEGASVRGTSRLTDVSPPTVLSTILRMGEGCDRLHNKLVRDLDIREIECDEQWSYIFKKQKNVNDNDPADFGDSYAYIALARTKKLIVSYRVGKRDEADTKAFIADLRARLVIIPEISTDGWQSYPVAVGQSFGGNVDHAVINKSFKGGVGRGRQDGEFDKYAPPTVEAMTKSVAHGVPNLDRASTSHVERFNLTTRMHIRRFLRRGNAFSKKLDHHKAAISLHIMWYNFCRVHESLRVTPAMEAGITNHVWSIEELVTRALSAEPCDVPQPKPLAPPEPLPGEKPAAARQTSTGSWLRVVQGGKGKASEPTKPPIPPAPPQPVRYSTPIVEDYEKHWREQEAKVWREREKRLAFFDDNDEDCPY